MSLRTAAFDSSHVSSWSGTTLVHETPQRRWTLAELAPARYRLDLLRCPAPDACRCVTSQEVDLHRGTGLLVTLRAGPRTTAAWRGAGSAAPSVTTLQRIAMLALAAVAAQQSVLEPGSLQEPPPHPPATAAGLPEPFPTRTLPAPCAE